MPPHCHRQRKNTGFGLPRKIGKNSRKIGKMAQQWVKLGFGVIFSFFSANFFLISGGGRNLYFSSTDPILGQRPEMGSVPGTQFLICTSIKAKASLEECHHTVIGHCRLLDSQWCQAQSHCNNRRCLPRSLTAHTTAKASFEAKFIRAPQKGPEKCCHAKIVETCRK